MAWVVAGATVVGGAANYLGGRSASRDQRRAAANAQASEERMFERSLELQQPYREAGYTALSGLQTLTDPVERGALLRNFYNTDEFEAMQNQATQSALRGPGSLRSGSTYQALENIAPQLGQNFLASQENRLTGLANLGTGAASQGASGAIGLGQAQGRYATEIGQANASQSLNAANQFNQTLGGLAGIYANSQTPPPPTKI